MKEKQILCLIAVICFLTIGERAYGGSDKISYHNWAVSALLEWSPPGQSTIEGARETIEEAQARYDAIVDDAIAVVFDPAEKPLFAGPYARSQTLALMLSTAWWESGYRRDVDLNIGKLARGDHGKSWCLMQIQLGSPKDSLGNTNLRIILKDDTFKFVRNKSEGLSGGDLIRNRQDCFRSGLHIMRGAFQWCKGIPIEDRLSGGYTGSSCTVGQRGSRVRFRKAVEWFHRSISPFNDTQLQSILNPTAMTELLPPYLEFTHSNFSEMSKLQIWWES